MSVPPPPAPTPHVAQGFQWWAPFAALAVVYSAAIVLVGILVGITGDTGDLSPGVTLAATFIQDGLLVAAMVGFARLGGTAPTPGAFGLRRVPLGPALKASGLAFLVFYAFLILWSQLDSEATDDLAADLGAKDSTVALIAVAVLVCLVAPVVEELFFRGFLFGALRQAMHWVPAAMLTGAVFGGVHAGGTPAIFLVPLAVFGFVLCALYRRTDSLVPGMGVHAFNNALALAVSLEWTFATGLFAVIAAPTAVVLLASHLAE